MLDWNLSAVFGQFWAWKTYMMVQQAFSAYKKWAIVISNCWLSFPHIRIYTPDDLLPILTDISTIHERYITPALAPSSFLVAHGISRLPIRNPVDPREKKLHYIFAKKKKWLQYFVLIDEAGLFFNSRNFQKNFQNPKILEMFVQPRKYGLQITMVAQSLGMMDKIIRNLAQEVIEVVPFIFGLGRRMYSYDKKYIDVMDSVWWNPDIPVVDRQTRWFVWLRHLDEKLFNGWLYYTREILGYSAIRHPSAITNIPDYIKKYPCPFLSIDSEAIKDAMRPKPEGVDSAKQITPERHERWASDMGVGTPQAPQELKQDKLPLWKKDI